MPTDARGFPAHDFKNKPTRIISLVPSQTELLYHLGLEVETVGITKFCIHPAQWFRTKARVGGTKNVAIEKIKSLQPDLIIANKEENVKEQVETLASHFPTWVTDVCTLADALKMISDVGLITGKEAKATFLKAHIEAAFKELAFDKNGKPYRVCYLIWKDPYLTVGGDTFIHEMLTQGGFENIFSAKARYPEVTIEELQQKAFDILMLSSEPYPFAEKHIHDLQLLLPDVKIILVDGEMFSWYGSRLQWTPAYLKKLHALLSGSMDK